MADRRSFTEAWAELSGDRDTSLSGEERRAAKKAAAAKVTEKKPKTDVTEIVKDIARPQKTDSVDVVKTESSEDTVRQDVIPYTNQTVKESYVPADGHEMMMDIGKGISIQIQSREMKTVRKSVLLRPSIEQKLQEISEQTGVSRNDLINRILADVLLGEKTSL